MPLLLTFDRDLHLGGTQGSALFLESSTCRGYVFGDCLGYVASDETLEREACMPELSSRIERGEDPAAFLRWTVGKFVVVLQYADSVKIYASPRYRGYFYYATADGLRINGDELSSAKECIDGGLDDMELLYYLFQIPTPSASPFRTILKRVNRAIGGTVLTVSADLDTSIELYVGRSAKLREGMSDEDYYQVFKRLFDDTSRLLGQSMAGSKIYLALSGGVDSAICMLSLRNQGFPVIPLHWRKDPELTEAIEIFCQRVGGDPVFFGLEYGQFDAVKLSWETTRHFYSNALGMTGPNNMNYALPDPNATYVSGFGGGALVQIDDLHRVSFGELPLTYHFEDTKTRKVYRFLFTKWFWRLVRWGVGSPYVRLAELIARQNHLRSPADIREYLLGLCVSGKAPCWPVHELPRDMEWTWERYVEHVRLNVLEPVAGHKRNGRINMNGGRGLSYEECLELMRQIRFATETQRGNKHAVGYEDGTGSRHESPITEGPMVSFFMNFPISLRDVLSVKRYFYRYFREAAGFSYPEYLAMLRKQRGISFRSKARAKALRSVRKVLGKRPPHREEIHNSLMTSDHYRQHFLPNFNREASRLLPMVEDPRLRDDLGAIYERYTASDLGKVSAQDSRVMNQVLNLELFLTHASEAAARHVDA